MTWIIAAHQGKNEKINQKWQGDISPDKDLAVGMAAVGNNYSKK